MNKFLMSHLMISALSFIYCQDSNTVQTIDLSEGTRLKLNSAYEKNNLLTAEWTLLPGNLTLVNFTVRLDNFEDEINDECILRHYAEPDIDTIELMSIHQLSKRHVLAEWKHSCADKAISYGTDIRKILIIDILYCKYVRNISYPVSMRKIPKDMIIYYDEGFDVIMTGWDCGAATNCRDRYDVNGKKLYGVNFLPLKFSWMTWQSVSKKSRSGGFFMRGTNFEENSPTQVYLVGNGARHLLNLRSRVRLISYSESEKWYVICGEDTYDAELICCAQYHVSKDKVFETQVMPSSRQLKFVGVRGLKNGGVLLFAFEGNSKLSLTEMLTGAQPKNHYYELQWHACDGNDFVIQVSESTRTFTVAYESNEPKHKVVIQTFDFPKNLRKN